MEIREEDDIYRNRMGMKLSYLEGAESKKSQENQRLQAAYQSNKVMNDNDMGLANTTKEKGSSNALEW